MTTNIVLAGV